MSARTQQPWAASLAVGGVAVILGAERRNKMETLRIRVRLGCRRNCMRTCEPPRHATPLSLVAHAPRLVTALPVHHGERVLVAAAGAVPGRAGNDLRSRGCKGAVAA